MDFSVNNRWNGIIRKYTQEDVKRISGSMKIEYTLAKVGSKKLWNLLNTKDYLAALGALTGHQAVQMAHAGLESIYLSGWQCAGDGPHGQTYPDMSLYPADTVPKMIERFNNAFQRMDQIDTMNGKTSDNFKPIVADCESGFGGNLNVYELVKQCIVAGAAGIHLEDQLASAKKCGHMGGKVLVNRSSFIEKLQAARLAADSMGVPTVIIARTDALSADLLTSDVDEDDRAFCTGVRTSEGFYRVSGGIDAAISRSLAYAPYCDLLWFETNDPNLDEAKKFADAIHKVYPGKLLAYNCSPSFNWKKKLHDDTIAKFQKELSNMNYKFQFVTLAGFHALNHGMYRLAKDYKEHGMTAYTRLQEDEFADERNGNYQAVKHQNFVGTGYFDQIANIISGGNSSLSAMHGSTEEEQFKH